MTHIRKTQSDMQSIFDGQRYGVILYLHISSHLLSLFISFFILTTASKDAFMTQCLICRIKQCDIELK